MDPESIVVELVGMEMAVVPLGGAGNGCQAPSGSMVSADTAPAELTTTASVPSSPTAVARITARGGRDSGDEKVQLPLGPSHAPTTTGCPSRRVRTSAVALGPVACSRRTSVADRQAAPDAVP